MDKPINEGFLKWYRDNPVQVMQNAVKNPMFYADDESAIISSHDIYVNTNYECVVGETDMRRLMERTRRGGATYFNLILPTGERFRLDIGTVRVNNPSILIRTVAPATRAFLCEFAEMLKNPKYSPKATVASKMMKNYNGDSWVIVSSSKAPYADPDLRI